MKKLICGYCSTSFDVSDRKWATTTSWIKRTGGKTYCSKKCMQHGRGFGGMITSTCIQCQSSFVRNAAQLKKSKNLFCSTNCAGYYNNAHKLKGCRRSKLEDWLQVKLLDLYSFELHFNRKDAINSELDVYIPSLKLAFELNGIFHYEPIYGVDRLDYIKNNDTRKFQACIENGISLCIIDTSQQRYFKEKTSYKYLNIIKDIIDQKIG